MRALTVAALLVALIDTGLAFAAGPASALRQAPGAARAAIVAAEDNRMVLPDGLHTPAIDALRIRLSDDLRTLLQLARASDPVTQARAIRALGRYERRELVTDLLPFLAAGPRAETANALAQSLRGKPLPSDPEGQQVQGVHEALLQAGETDGGAALGAISRSLARLPYSRASQVQSADAFLLASMRRMDPDRTGREALADITRAVESLARIHGRLAPIGGDTIEWLRRIVLGTRYSYPPAARVSALAALITARGVDAETLRASADRGGPPELRRLAAVMLGGAGSPVAATEHTDLLISLLSDPSAMVRLDAVRAWVRQEAATNGCLRIIDAMKDPNTGVALAAIDALGDACRDDVNVTDRLMVEARTPPASDWLRPSRALVALAKRAPARVVVPLLGGFVSHPTWQVRVYAVRAAALINEVPTLERLAFDPIDNVREAALGPLRRLKGDEAEPDFVAALARPDYQLLRTAAIELKGAKPTPQLQAALADALRRVTVEKKETSRDTRLALVERLAELGDPDQAGALIPLLEDFDIPVATAAARLLGQWTGRAQEIAPLPQTRPSLPLSDGPPPVRVKLGNGRILHITLLTEAAPLSSGRFIRLAQAGYYEGLTFHRAPANFVVQGGSPGANEYSGDGPFVHDEIGLAPHTRGSIGLSTRGRDTGDGQFFINLVDNPRLDFEYTVFGNVDPGDLAILETIQEGERIVSVTFDTDEDDKKDAAAPPYANAGATSRANRCIDASTASCDRSPNQKLALK